MFVTTFFGSIATPLIFARPFGEVAGVLVVAMQSFRRFFQSDQAGGSENSDLAHSAAEQLPADVGFLDEVARAEKQRADGSAETFREAEHHRIEFAREVGDAAAERDRRVEDSRAVEMHLKVRGVRVVADVVGNFLRIDGAAMHVVRIFERDERGLRIVINFRADQRLDQVPGENAVGRGRRCAEGIRRSRRSRRVRRD